MAATTPDLPNVDLGADKKGGFAEHSRASHIHTPPASDMSSHGQKDDDAGSSSSLSDIDDDQIEEDIRFEDNTAGARTGVERDQAGEFLDIKPDHYEGGIPIFTPTMEEFRNFEKYVGAVDKYGMQSGIVLIDPPEEWKRARKSLDEMVKAIKVKNPINQEFHGAQGIYTQRNMEKQRSYNLPQWKALCECAENQPPARRGETRNNINKAAGRAARKLRSETEPAVEGGKCRTSRPMAHPIKEEPTEAEPNLISPPTPVSPETQPAATVKVEGGDGTEEQADPTPTKKRGRKPGPKPKGRQPKAAGGKGGNRAGGKGEETTVAARRLRNARAAIDEIDEEAFRGFDYRVYDNDQWTAERCNELEEKYWKSLNFSNPMYGADMPGSLFDDDTKEWNVAKLPNLLDLLGQPIPGVNTAYLYLGMWRATFAWHLEDVDLYSINYIHFGAPKQWYSISQADAPKFENAMRTLWPQDSKTCDQFLRHKTYLVSPDLLKKNFGVKVNKVVHREGQFVITFPIGYHSGYNLGYNCAESVNFAIENWLHYGQKSKKCRCEADSVFINVDWFIRKLRGDPSPEFEEIEVTDDEDDVDELLTDLPTPPGSVKGRIKIPSKRKRPAKDAGPNKKAKKIIKIRKVSKHQPCCLCPNDHPWEQLLPTENGQQAHRKCAMFTAETYIVSHDGSEKVMGVENISKERLELKCAECRQKKGSCFQCSSAKCTRAYHATCAAQAGVQIDEGDVAIWHEGVEYRDTSFDWRCRLHRTVKKPKPSNDMLVSNYYATDTISTGLHNYLLQRKLNDIIQWQVSHVDDIEAGLVVRPYDPECRSITVKVLPTLKFAREIEAPWVLFVDESTSCLTKPSPNALALPEHLQGKTASLPESTERKPSPGDPFTEDPKTEWAEFVAGPSPSNKAQKPVDWNKPKTWWYFLGQTSTESKAQYTSDPSKPVHDPESNFLQTVEPSRPLPGPLPPRRPSLAASYPTSTANMNMAARNAAMVNARQQMLERQYPNFQRGLVRVSPAMSPDQRQILERQYHKAQHLDMLESRSQMPIQCQVTGVGIGIDLQAVERQKRFQQQATLGTLDSRCFNTWQAQPSLPPLTNYQVDAQAQTRECVPHPVNYSGYGRFTLSGSPSSVPSQAHSPNVSSPPLAAGQPYRAPDNGASPVYETPQHSQHPLYGADSSHHLTPSQLGGDDDRARINAERTRIEEARAAAKQPPAPPNFRHEHRMSSSSAYPFKPPEELKARKQERDLVAHTSASQLDGGFLPRSPHVAEEQLPAFQNQPLQHAGPPDQAGAHDLPPPSFINPNATQLNPEKNHVFSDSPAVVTSVAAAHRESMPTLPAESLSDPNRGRPPLPQESSRPAVPAYSPHLVEAISPRQILPDGQSANDRDVPVIYQQWREGGGFWGDVADYFIKGHLKRRSVHRSPWTNNSIQDPAPGGATSLQVGNVDKVPLDGGEHHRNKSLADEFYDCLSEENRAKIDQVRSGSDDGMRVVASGEKGD